MQSDNYIATMEMHNKYEDSRSTSSIVDATSDRFRLHSSPSSRMYEFLQQNNRIHIFKGICLTLMTLCVLASLVLGIMFTQRTTAIYQRLEVMSETQDLLIKTLAQISETIDMKNTDDSGPYASAQNAANVQSYALDKLQTDQQFRFENQSNALDKLQTEQQSRFENQSNAFEQLQKTQQSQFDNQNGVLERLKTDQQNRFDQLEKSLLDKIGSLKDDQLDNLEHWGNTLKVQADRRMASTIEVMKTNQRTIEAGQRTLFEQLKPKVLQQQSFLNITNDMNNNINNQTSRIINTLLRMNRTNHARINEFEDNSNKTLVQLTKTILETMATNVTKRLDGLHGSLQVNQGMWHTTFVDVFKIQQDIENLSTLVIELISNSSSGAECNLTSVLTSIQQPSIPDPQLQFVNQSLTTHLKSVNDTMVTLFSVMHNQYEEINDGITSIRTSPPFNVRPRPYPSRPVDTHKDLLSNITMTLCSEFHGCQVELKPGADKRCFKSFSKPLLNWKNAKSFCFRQGGFLAEIHDEITMRYVDDKVFAGSRSWLGASDILVEGQWTWATSGRNLTVADWLPGEPSNKNNDQHCLELYSSGKWNDFRCSNNQGYICQKVGPKCEEWAL